MFAKTYVYILHNKDTMNSLINKKHIWETPMISLQIHITMNNNIMISNKSVRFI